MPKNHTAQNSTQRRSIARADRLFGLRVEGHLMQLAIGTRQLDGTYSVEFDQIASETGQDWLVTGNGIEFADAFRQLVEKHQMRRGQIAVSLDGDYCVTRVLMGSPEHIDKELEMLLARAARYLSLGPGEKIAGITRNRIHSGIDYVAAAVINQSIIERIYDAMLKQDMNVRWVEPSLVSIARLIDASGVAQDEPLLIADGTGSRWDIGIVHCGRLLLDYRPASASTIDEIRVTTESHIERLRRFCSRHRNIVGGTLSRVLVVGTEENAQQAKIAFGTIDALAADVVAVPYLPSVYRLMGGVSEDCIPAIGAILPLLMNTDSTTIPDMLATIRREAKASWHRRLLSDGWPGIAAAVFLICGYSTLSAERIIVASATEGHKAIKAQVVERQTKLAVLTKQRELISYLQTIDADTTEVDWPVVLDHVTQCLADEARVNQFQYDDQQGLRVDGSVQSESIIYDYVGHLRRLTEVKQVALQGTSPLEGDKGANFRVLLQIDSSPIPDTTRTVKAYTNSAARLLNTNHGVTR